jgi:hypothetical protein
VLVDVAARTGALTSAGLTVDEIPVTSSPAQFAALLAGELDAVVTNPDNVVAYRCVEDNPLGRTDDVRILAALDRGLGLALFGQPGQTTAEALGGTVLGVDVATSGFAFVAYELLDRLNVQNYTVVALGSTPRRGTALLSGHCAVTVLNAGTDLRAEAAGALRLAGVTSIGPYVGAALATVGDTQLGPLAEALLATSAELADGKHSDVALEAAQRRLDLDQAGAARYLEILMDPAQGLVPDGRMSRADMQTTVELRNRHSPASQRVSLAAALSCLA